MLWLINKQSSSICVSLIHKQRNYVFFHSYLHIYSVSICFTCTCSFCLHKMKLFFCNHRNTVKIPRLEFPSGGKSRNKEPFWKHGWFFKEMYFTILLLSDVNRNKLYAKHGSMLAYLIPNLRCREMGQALAALRHSYSILNCLGLSTSSSPKNSLLQLIYILICKKQ